MYRSTAIRKHVAALCATAWIGTTGALAGPDAPATLDLMDAVRTTLASQPSILIQQKQVEIGTGTLQQAQGTFDLSANAGAYLSNTNYPLTAAQREQSKLTETQYRYTGYSAGLSKQFRSGISVLPSASVSRSDNLDAPVASPNVASVSFAVVVPLLQGRGRDAVAVGEISARINLEASKLDLQNTVAVGVLNTVTAYWNLLGAQHLVSILKEFEHGARSTVSDYHKLAKADAVPSADLEQWNANLSIDIAQRITYEQQMESARATLGLAMGLHFDRIAALPAASTPFPEPPDADLTAPGTTNLSTLLQFAKARRTDLQAQTRRKDSNSALVRAAVINTRPQLSLYLSTGYSGLQESDSASGYYDSYADNRTDLNALASLSYNFPLANTAARGILRQQRATLDQAVIQEMDLERNIYSSVQVAAENVRRSLESWRNYRFAAQAYQRAYENEKRKLRMDASTVINVIAMEDKLRSARINEIQSLQSYAIAIATLRYQTGTLVYDNTETQQINLQQLMTAP